MPSKYGETRRADRRDARGSAGKQSRGDRIAKLREKPSSIPKQVASNTRKLTKLSRLATYGPIQHQVTYVNNLTPTRDHPIIFQVNNPGYGTFGPVQMTVSNAQSPHGIGHGDVRWQLEHTHLANKDETHELPNGNKMFLKYVDFSFRFHGWVSNKHVRIDFIRQKSVGNQADMWNPHTGKQFLPYPIEDFKRLAGWTTNSIDYKRFEVLKTVKVFVNSKGNSPPLHQAADVVENGVEDANDHGEVMTPGTTNSEIIRHVRLNINKAYKQLDSSKVYSGGTDGLIGEDDINLDAHNDDHGHSEGPYSFDNLNPFTNIWCVLSCDDDTALASIITGDSVGIDIIRRCCWRDSDKLMP